MEMNKNLIIQLLIQDMKHEQLINGINQLGFTSELHSLNLFNIIAGLMGMEEKEISWAWSDIYINFISQVSKYEITIEGENLLPLAETCYQFLISCVEKERQNA